MALNFFFTRFKQGSYILIDTGAGRDGRMLTFSGR